MASVASTVKLTPAFLEVTASPITTPPSGDTTIGPEAVTAAHGMVSVFDRVISPERPTASGINLRSDAASCDSPTASSPSSLEPIV